MQPILRQVNLKFKAGGEKANKGRRERKINNIAFSAFSNFGICNLAPGAKTSVVLDLQVTNCFEQFQCFLVGPGSAQLLS